ncbi:MAG: hypothetical protein F9K23_04850 [Bacteroidetes bacterium]|nr:MAG: hypothetical protein F9K23_04850 [Bacteroidota bacterium]
MRYHIPTPCHENWDKMSPTVQGRFCSLCSKTVVDFTRMSDEEVLNYFANHKNENICGRIKKQPQLPEITIHIPASTIHRRYNYFQTFLLALLLSFGLLLTGFTGEKTHAEFALENTNSIAAVDSPPPAIELPYPDPTEEIILGKMMILPAYPGGEEARIKFVDEKLTSLDLSSYADSLPRKVLTHFYLDSTGKATNAKIINGGLDSAFNHQIINIIYAMPLWDMADIHSSRIPIKLSMPIKILRKE